MKQRNLRQVRLAAAILLAITTAVFASGFFFQPSRKYLSLGHSFHITVWKTGIDSRLVFFNDNAYGPYRGSTIGLEGSQLPQVTGFGDKWGIYYRHVELPKSTLWTLMVSLWYPITVLAIVSGALLRRSSRSIPNGQALTR